MQTAYAHAREAGEIRGCVVMTKAGQVCTFEPQAAWGDLRLPVCHLHNPAGMFCLQHPGGAERTVAMLSAIEAAQLANAVPDLEQFVTPPSGGKSPYVTARRAKQIVVEDQVRLGVDCPECGSPAGRRCVYRNAGGRRRNHPARRDVYAAGVAAEVLF